MPHTADMTLVIRERCPHTEPSNGYQDSLVVRV